MYSLNYAVLLELAGYSTHPPVPVFACSCPNGMASVLGLVGSIITVQKIPPEDITQQTEKLFRVLLICSKKTNMEILGSNFRSHFLNPQFNSIQIQDSYCLHMFITAWMGLPFVNSALLSVLKLYAPDIFFCLKVNKTT